MPHLPPPHRPSARIADSRPSAARRGYGPNWRKFRLIVLARRPVCECCQRAAASHVDHIRPIADGGDIYDERNLQCLCHSCHSRKTATQDGGFGNHKKREGHK